MTKGELFQKLQNVGLSPKYTADNIIMMKCPCCNNPKATITITGDDLKYDCPGKHYGRGYGDKDYDIRYDLALMDNALGSDTLKDREIAEAEAAEAIDFSDIFPDDETEEDSDTIPEDRLYIWKTDRQKREYPAEVILDAWREWITEKFHVITINSIAYLYDPERGAYVQDIQDKLLSTTIRENLRPIFRKPHTINQIVQLIKQDYHISKTDIELNRQPKTWINFLNGMVDIITGEIHPHDPKYYSTNQIPHNYRADAGQPFLTEFLQSRIDTQEDIDMLMTYAGSCMMAAPQFRNFMVLTGPTGVGKSVFLAALLRILGEYNVSAVPLQALSTRFSKSSLYGKITNICGDLSPKPIEDSGMLKQLTGCGDTIYAEYKGVDGFSFVNRASLIFSANRVPKFLNEETDAIFDRLMVVRFHQGTEYDYLEQRLTEETEIEAEISYMMRCLREELLTGKGRNQMRKTAACKKEVATVRGRSDSIQAFLDEECTIDGKSTVKRGTLYDEYQQYCITYGRESVNKSTFFDYMRQKGFSEKSVQGDIHFVGLTDMSPEMVAQLQQETDFINIRGEE